MESSYPLEWVDNLISITLNPRRLDFSPIGREEIQRLSDLVMIESQKIKAELKSAVFSLHKESQIRLLVQKYHSFLIILLDTILEYKENDIFIKSDLENLSETIVSILEEILSFIETRFSDFLSLDERVPATYLKVSKKELNIKISKVRPSILEETTDSLLTDLVFESLDRFINNSRQETVTFKVLLYKKELVIGLEKLGSYKKQTSVFNALTELLVYLNFNSRSFVNYLMQMINGKINQLKDNLEQLDSLIFHLKEFRQIQGRKNTALNPNHESIKSLLGKWFKNEIFYREKRGTLSTNIKTVSKPAQQITPLKINSVLFNLSVDQIALLLRGADDARVITAKSLSEVFKYATQYIVTPYKGKVSYNSMRSKSYHPQPKDKEIAIQALQKIIDRIRDY